MSEQQVQLGKLVSISQDDYDNGIQELVLEFDSGITKIQKREWPTGKYDNGDDFIPHNSIYYSEEFREVEKYSPDLAYAIISKCSKLVDGEEIWHDDQQLALESFIEGHVNADIQEETDFGWFSVVRAMVEHSKWNGEMLEPKEHVYVKGREGVSIVLYDQKEDRVVIIEEFRIGAAMNNNAADGKGWLVGIPTGGCERPDDDSDYDPIECAVREAEEEANLKPKYVEYMNTVYASPGYSTHIMHQYYGIVDINELSSEIGGLDNEGEDIKITTVDVSEVKSDILNGKHYNGTSVAALNHFFLYHYENAKTLDYSNIEEDS